MDRLGSDAARKGRCRTALAPPVREPGDSECPISTHCGMEDGRSGLFGDRGCAVLKLVSSDFVHAWRSDRLWGPTELRLCSTGENGFL